MKGDKFIIEQGYIDAAEQLAGLLLPEIERSQNTFMKNGKRPENQD